MFNKMLKAMNLERDEDEDFEEDDDDGKEATSFFSKMVSTAGDDAEEEPRKPIVKASKPVASRNKVKGKTQMEIVIFKPKSFDESREICETLLADRAVVLDMDNLDINVAQRIIDFLSGACYALDGNMQKINQNIFVITPSAVELSGDVLSTMMGGNDYSGINVGF